MLEISFKFSNYSMIALDNRLQARTSIFFSKTQKV